MKLGGRMRRRRSARELEAAAQELQEEGASLGEISAILRVPLSVAEALVSGRPMKNREGD